MNNSEIYDIIWMDRLELCINSAVGVSDSYVTACLLAISTFCSFLAVFPCIALLSVCVLPQGREELPHLLLHLCWPG